MRKGMFLLFCSLMLAMEGCSEGTQHIEATSEETEEDFGDMGGNGD